ncbi:hypothetical protein J1902_19050, partial [Arthrobacter sp. PO-11]|nr:hypothetical protein [Arthrobacter cavernae]
MGSSTARVSPKPWAARQDSSLKFQALRYVTGGQDGPGVPIFAWRLKDGYSDNWNFYHLSERLRRRG